MQSMILFFKTDTITSTAILPRAPPTPSGLIPRFLSRGINLQDRKTSMVLVSIRYVCSFLTTFANAFQRFLLAVSKLFDARRLLF